MFFSILVPVYNVEKYLHKCIASILEQTEQDFELILVDDGSKDYSGGICDYYRSLLPDKIKVIHQENKGLLLTRRVSINEAQGQFYVFVDSDDYIRKDMLEILRKSFEENAVDLIIFNYRNVDDLGNISARIGVFSESRIFNENNKQEVYERLLRDDSLNSIVIKAVRAEIVDKEYDYSSAAHVNMAEDLLQTLPLVTNSANIVYLNEDLYYYRQNVSSMTKTFNNIWFKSMDYVYLELKAYMKLWGLENEKGFMLLRHRYTLLIKEGIRQISLSDCPWDFCNKREFLERLAESEYFKEAYCNGVSERDLRWLVILNLMKRRRFSLVLYIVDARRAFRQNFKCNKSIAVQGILDEEG